MSDTEPLDPLNGPRGPWSCGNCDNSFVEIDEAVGLGDERFFVISHCVTCDTTVGNIKMGGEIDLYERESDRLALEALKRNRAQQRPLSNRERLINFDPEIEAFARALREGDILPEHF